LQKIKKNWFVRTKMSASFIVSPTTSSNCHNSYKNDEDDGKKPLDSNFNQFLFVADKQQSQPTTSALQPMNSVENDTLTSTTKSNTTFPYQYSEDLLRILKEVAAKGSSSVLPWKRSDKRQLSDRTIDGGKYAMSVSTMQASTQEMGGSNSTGSNSRRYHDYYHQASRRNSSSHKHKRSRISTTLPSRHLHSTRSTNSIGGGSGSGSSGGGSSSRNAASTTMTSTMVVEPKHSNITYINGTVQPTATTSNLFVLRPQSSSQTTTTTYQNSLFSSSHSIGMVGSVGNNSGSRSTSAVANAVASGSEYDDTSQYECDSEGTSATSNSEMSFSSNISKRRTLSMGNIVASRNSNTSFKITTTSTKRSDQVRQHYISVQDALRYALNLVLDYYYSHHGGYKVSRTEKQICSSAIDTIKSTNEVSNVTNDDTTRTNQPVAMSDEEIFQKRKKRLLDMLGRYCEGNLDQEGSNSDTEKASNIVISSYRGNAKNTIHPPFTIQRVAEVLMEPERYYKQTHKLCNCMEKLLLITSSASAFGGNVGEDTMQYRYEETESIALSKERTRVRSEFRQRHRKSRRKVSASALGSNVTTESNLKSDIDGNGIISYTALKTNNEIPDADAEDDDDELQDQSSTPNEMQLDAVARATLRNKFDHVGIDPHSQNAIANSRDVVALIESRRMTNSPPPPLTSSHTGLQLHRSNHGSPSSSKSSPTSSPDSNKSMLSPRIPSPLLFQHTNYNNNNVYDGSARLSPPLAPILSHPTNMHVLQLQQHYTNLSTSSAGQREVADGEHRSSPQASSSDIDSESDLDDSASDRSDGSDPGIVSAALSYVYEPLTAAQAMALNRRQQQVRIHNRSASSSQQQQQNQPVGNSNHGIMDGYNSMNNYNSNNYNVRILSNTDIEYQSGSGDSVDSTRAEDSGGSDSSSTTSDHAD
jgi:hypothetical protein